MAIQLVKKSAFQPSAIDDCVAAARAMIPVLREREPAATALRRVPSETIADFHDAGFFRLAQPRRWGGTDSNFDVVSRVIEELAQGCASSAWVYGVLLLHHLYLSVWPDDVQEAVWGSHSETLISSGLAPRPVERVPGGYRVDGDWAFSSGCDHAGYAMVGGAIEGAPPVMLLIPMSDIQIVDDWHTFGLRATGSKTLRLDEVFVPERWAVSYPVLMGPVRSGNPLDPNSLWDRAPNLLFSAYTFSSVILGLSRKGVRIASDALRTKVSRGVKLGESPTHQLRIGEVLATVETARFYLHQTARAHSERVRRGEAFTGREVWESAAQVALLVRNMRNAMLTLTDTSSSWIYDRDPLQQVLRDIMTGATHRSASLDAMYTPSGKTLIMDAGY